MRDRGTLLDMSEAEIALGASCRPNFSGAGRRRRRNAAIASAIIAVILLIAFVVLDVSWPMRLLFGLPVGGAVISELQVRRNTCVAHAATGVLENEDMSTTKVDEEFAAASRKVAATIWRDGILAAVGAALLGAASAWAA